MFKREIVLGLSLLSASTIMAQGLQYPQARKDNAVVDSYFGTNVQDPYRWLEDDRSAETAQWVKDENNVTFSYLDKIPFRKNIHQRFEKIWNFQKFGVPFEKGPYLFYYKNDGVQNQSVLYIQSKTGGKADAILDPNTMSKEGTTAISGLAISNNHKYLAYSISKAGSDWQEIKVMDIASSKLLNDNIDWVKFSGIAWKADGFYYSRYPEPSKGQEFSSQNQYHKIYFHKLGTSQAQDILVHEDKEHPLRNFGAGVTDDERFLIISGSETTSGSSLTVYDLKNGSKKYEIVNDFSNDYNVIDNQGDDLIVLTNNNAPRKRLVKININKPSAADWKTIIPESKNVITDVVQTSDKLAVEFMVDASSRLSLYDYNGKLVKEIVLPGIGTVNGVSGSKKSDRLFYGFVNFTQPTSIYEYSILKGNTSEYAKPNIDFKSDDYITKQVFFLSKDGTKVPMFIVHKKGIKLDGNNPCWIYGYGGFQVSITPEFRLDRLPFLEQGGIYAVPNLRGGGEYGEEWHESGTKMKKQNVFNDFISAAEYLIKEGYTNSQKLACMGRSNGGLLIGAAITQRPDLYKVAFPGVGVLDMLRFHKFTIGWAWTGDYGSSEQSAEMFEYLYKYSPLHNIKDNVSYPSTMITTADHDDRVVPAHSFKFAATLQEKYKGNNPLLIRVDVNAGHGAGKPTSKQIDEASDVLSFMMYQLGMEPKW